MNRERRRETNLDAVEHAGAVPSSIALGKDMPKTNSVPGPVSYAFLRVRKDAANEMVIDPEEVQIMQDGLVARLRPTAICLPDGTTTAEVLVFRTAYEGEEE